MIDLSNLDAVLARIDALAGKVGSLGGATAQVAPAEGQPAAGKQAFQAALQAAANRAGLPDALVGAVVQAESGGNPEAVSSTGAEGLMQLMPGTAHGLGVTDPFDPAQNLDGGSRYLRAMIDKYHDLPKALAAYNAGPGAVDAHGGVPPFPETQGYVRRVMDLYRANQRQEGTP